MQTGYLLLSDHQLLRLQQTQQPHRVPQKVRALKALRRRLKILRVVSHPLHPPKLQTVHHVLLQQGLLPVEILHAEERNAAAILQPAVHAVSGGDHH